MCQVTLIVASIDGVLYEYHVSGEPHRPKSVSPQLIIKCSDALLHVLERHRRAAEEKVWLQLRTCLRPMLP